MKKANFFVFLICLCSFLTSLQAQHHVSSQAACESEVANLKEQIRRIILDSQRNLEETEHKLTAALQRINALEAENERLTELAEINGEVKKTQHKRLSKKLRETEALNARLSDENASLKGQLQGIMQNQEDEQIRYTSALEDAQKADRSQLRQQRENQR